MLCEKLKKYLIDKSKPEWRYKRRNISGREVEIPDSLNGEILLEEVIDEKGRCRGWITVHPDALEELFQDAVQEHLKTGRRLGELMLEHDDIFEEVDLDKSPEEEAIRIVATRMGIKPEEVSMLTPMERARIRNSPAFSRIRSLIENEKGRGKRGKVKIRVGEKGYKKYIRKWMEEGLI